MERVYLGLGSNLGDSAAIIGAAFTACSDFLSEARLSSLWRSRARYVEDQPDFNNAVVVGETGLEPLEVLEAINDIEERFGRDRKAERRRGPRPLDIDILLFGERLIILSGLIVPHAGIRERKFALLPLLELAPTIRDPASGESFERILARLPAQGIYLLGSGGYDLLHL